MARRFYDEVPLFGGDLSVASDLDATSLIRHNRVAMFGNSQETMPAGYGNDFVGGLNLFAKRRYGPPSESLVCGGQAETTRYGTSALIQTDSAAAVNYTLQSLPGLPVKSSSADATYTNHSVAQLQFRGHSSVPGLNNIEDYFTYDKSNIRMEFFAAVNPSGPKKIRWLYIPNTVEGMSTGQPVVQQSLSFGTENEVGTDGLVADKFVKYRTSVIATTARDYPQVIWYGNDGGGTVQAGLNMAGMRWILNPDDPHGMGIQSFAFGGATINATNGGTPWRANHGTSYEQFKVYGPWAAIIIAMGINDAVRGVDDDLHKTELLEWIAEFRGANWGQWEVPIILVGECRPAYPGSFTDPQYDALKRQSQVHYEIAEELQGQRVMSINTMRSMEEAGYDASIAGANPASDHTVDGIHYHPIWAQKRAELFFNIMSAAGAPASGVTGIRRVF